MKNLLIATDTCSLKKEMYLSEHRKKQIVNPQQKFFRLMIEGLAEDSELSTTILSALPVSASTYAQKKFGYEEETVKKANYHYLSFRNGKFTRYLTLILSSAKEIRKWTKSKDSNNSIVITDPLVPVLSIPVRIIAQKRGLKVGAIVTDIPSLCSNMKGRKEGGIKTNLLKLYQRISDNDLSKYDFYITLTESLNEAVNVKKKPHIVIEGFADSKDIEVSSEHKHYIMYAGGVYEKFGLKALVNGFMKMENQDFELWIFGDGPYVSEIIEYSKANKRIKYKGCVTSKEIVAYEKEAYLLVNPRPTDEEFAKYSFPSKTMEYLLSGTPVVSTRLPGIPDEYFNYIYAFYGQDADSIGNTLDDILRINYNALLAKGKAGHDFVMNEKNNIVMARKIKNFINNI